MAKVIKTIASEDGMTFEEIMSFKTENYIGIWNCVDERFMLINKYSQIFEPYYLIKEHGTLQELDDEVYINCDEHITEVFDKSDYTFALNFGD